MEHVPSGHGRRESVVRRLAWARVARHAAERLRERVRAALARWAGIVTELRAAYVRALARIGERVRLDRARADRVRVAWRDPVTPTAADRVEVPRLCDPVAHWARGGPVVYPDTPGPVPGVSDVMSPELGRRGMSSNLIYIDETHHHTTPPTIDAETLARIDADTEATIRRLRKDY